MSKTIGWDRRLAVSGSGKNLGGHAGAVLLRACADRTGLTGALSAVMPGSAAADWWDRGVTLVGTAVAIVLGAACMSDVERLWAYQAVVFGAPASNSTINRTLAGVDEGLLAKVAGARARVRRHVWTLLRLRPGGFPWLVVAGKRLTGWIVIDIDATLITAHSAKAGAAVTFKKTFGGPGVLRLVPELMVLGGKITPVRWPRRPSVSTVIRIRAGVVGATECGDDGLGSGLAGLRVCREDLVLVVAVQKDLRA